MINYPKTVEVIKEMHEEFLKKYRNLIEKNVNERHLERETVYARLTLFAKAFKGAGVIERYEDLVISGIDKNLTFITHKGERFYLLNGINSVVFLAGNSAALDMYKDVFFPLYLDDSNKVVLKNVLSDDFDWILAAKKVLEIIHKDAYRKTEVLNDYIKRQLSIEPDCN